MAWGVPSRVFISTASPPPSPLSTPSPSPCSPPRSSARALFPPLQGPLCPSAPPGGAGMWLKVLPGPYCLCMAAARWNRPTGTARRPRRLSLSPSRYRRSRRNTAGTPRTSPCGSPRRRLPWSNWRFCPQRKCREKVPEGKTLPWPANIQARGVGEQDPGTGCTKSITSRSGQGAEVQERAQQRSKKTTWEGSASKGARR